MSEYEAGMVTDESPACTGVEAGVMSYIRGNVGETVVLVETIVVTNS